MGNPVQIDGEPEREEAEEDPSDFEPKDVADAGEGTEEAEDAASGSFCSLSAGLHGHLPGGLVGLGAQSLSLLRECLGLGDGVWAVGGCLQAFPGQAPCEAHPDAQFSSKFCGFHAVLSVAAGRPSWIPVLFRC